MERAPGTGVATPPLGGEVLAHYEGRLLDGTPVGTARLTPDHHVGRMAVRAPWRGRGVGDALLLALVEEARRRGWPAVHLNSQVSAIGFYERHGFRPQGERFMEAGIEHQAMQRTLEPLAGPDRPPARPRGPSTAAEEFDSMSAATEATIRLVDDARRDIRIFSRDLDPVLYSQPAVIDAFRRFATAGRGGVVQVIVLDPAAVQGQGHPLLGLAQRLTSVFQFRTPVEDVDLQYPSAFLANDRDGYLFRQLGSRWDGDWSPTHPARTRQLAEHFGRVWERSRACTEFRALGI